MSKGQISINKVTVCENRGNKDDYISICIEDELSSITFFEGEISFEDFAKCITGSSRPINFTIRGTEKIGKKMEIKHEYVALAHFSPTDREIENALKPHEKNGWIGSRLDCKNFHNYTNDGYTVSFRRWIDIG